MSTLNGDCWSVVISHLRLVDQLTCRLVNRQFYQWINQHVIPVLKFRCGLPATSFRQIILDVVGSAYLRYQDNGELVHPSWSHKSMVSREVIHHAQVHSLRATRVDCPFPHRLSRVKTKYSGMKKITSPTQECSLLTELVAPHLTNAFLVQCPHLRLLGVYLPHKIDILPPLGQLEQLVLCKVNLTMDLSALTQLRKLKLFGSTIIYDAATLGRLDYFAPGPTFDPSWYEACTRLTTLDLSYLPPHQDIPTECYTLTRLTRLVSNRPVDFTRFPTVTSFRLRNGVVNSEHPEIMLNPVYPITAYSGLRQLTDLSLKYCPSPEELRQLTHLQTLTIRAGYLPSVGAPDFTVLGQVRLDQQVGPFAGAGELH